MVHGVEMQRGKWECLSLCNLAIMRKLSVNSELTQAMFLGENWIKNK